MRSSGHRRAKLSDIRRLRPVRSHRDSMRLASFTARPMAVKSSRSGVPMLP